jgi:hypothetical protein
VTRWADFEVCGPLLTVVPTRSMRGCKNEPGGAFWHRSGSYAIVLPGLRIGLMMVTAADSIRTYIRSKDENRPHLLRHAFAHSATVEMIVKTDAISFPSSATGLEAIADMLVSRFGQTYENVYTFCLSSPPENGCRQFSCDWLVGMSEKKSRVVRVGYGRYDWFFAADKPGLITKLIITIESMQILGDGHLLSIIDWLSGIPYPWCPSDVATRSAPDLEELAGLMQRLKAITAERDAAIPR